MIIDTERIVEHYCGHFTVEHSDKGKQGRKDVYTSSVT
jgi:hypothetical protein